VLLEPCDVPDLRVDTVSLRHFQWHPQYRSTVRELVELVSGVVKPKTTSANQLPPLAQAPAPMPGDKWFLEVASKTTTPSQEAPGDTLKDVADSIQKIVNCVAWGNLADLQSILWSTALSRVDINITSASDCLRKISDPRLATGAAVVFGELCQRNHRDRLSQGGRRLLRSWLQHGVPEVGAISSMLLAQTKKPAAADLDWLTSYSQRSDRLAGAHFFLRHFVTPLSLAPIMEHAPDIAWETFGNDPHLAGMELRHVSFHHSTARFQKLSRHPYWKTREIAAAVTTADERVPFETKLVLLSDAEPRVRFRALEGLLHSTHRENMPQIIAALLAAPPAESEGRTFRVRGFRDDKCAIGILEDSSVPQPTASSFSFSNIDTWGVEASGPVPLTLRGIQIS